MLLISSESAIDLLSFTAMALAKFAIITILLHSVYFALASLSFGRTLVTYTEKKKSPISLNVQKKSMKTRNKVSKRWRTIWITNYAKNVIFLNYRHLKLNMNHSVLQNSAGKAKLIEKKKASSM